MIRAILRVYIYIHTEIVSMILHVPCILMLHTETWHWKSQARYCLRSVKKDASTTNPIMLGATSLLWVALDVLHIWGFPKMVVPPFHIPKSSFLVGKPMGLLGKPTILGNNHMLILGLSLQTLPCLQMRTSLPLSSCCLNDRDSGKWSIHKCLNKCLQQRAM